MKLSNIVLSVAAFLAVAAYTDIRNTLDKVVAEQAVKSELLNRQVIATEHAATALGRLESDIILSGGVDNGVLVLLIPDSNRRKAVLIKAE